MKKCEICGTAMNDDVTVCPECGATVGKVVQRSATNVVCGACGASVAANKKFCPQCGARMTAEKKPVEEPKPAEEEPAQSGAADKICLTCGATVGANKKFCPQCGAKMTAEKKPVEASKPAIEEPAQSGAADKLCLTCGAIVAPGKRFCPNCGSRMEEIKPIEDVISFCPECGAKVEAGKKFCADCGTPLTPTRTAAKTPVFKPSGAAATASGRVRQILPTIGIALTLIMTIVFMFVPFLSVKVSAMGVEVAKASQHGITGLAVLFTGKSDLISGGNSMVPIISGANGVVMRLVGAGYIALLLAVIWYLLFAISGILKYDKNTLKRQIVLSAVLTAISLFLMVLCIITKTQINKHIKELLSASGSVAGSNVAALYKTGWFMGAVGLFIVNALMLGYSIAMRAIYSPSLDRAAATPDLLNKAACRVLALVDVLVVIACIVVPIVTSCSGGIADDPMSAKEIKASDTFKLKCKDSYSSNETLGMTMYYGVAYFVYTPASNGTISVEITNGGGISSGSSAIATSASTVEIDEYDDVYELYRREGNFGVMDDMSGDTEASLSVRAGTKYCIYFGAASLNKDDKIEVSYTFDDGGTRGGGDIGNDSSRNNATALSPGNGVSTGPISSGGSKWYKFTPSASGMYIIESSNITGDPDLNVYDSLSSSTPFESDNSSGGFSKSMTLTAGTTYYIEIKSYTGTSSCTFMIKSNEGSTRENAVVIALDGRTTTGSMRSGARKWYKFTPSTSGTYKISSYTVSGNPDLNVYDSLYSYSAVQSDSSSGGFDVSVVMTAYSTYYIEIYAAENNSSCTFTVSKTSDGSTRGSATLLTLGSSVSTGSISSDNSKWYKYTPMTGGRYNIKSTTFYGDPDVKVYASATSSYYIASDENSGGFEMSVYMNAGTTYYIEVCSSYNASSCTFSINAEVEGSTRTTALTVALGNSVMTGNISSGDDKWYKFTPSASGTYNIKSATYHGDPDISVYDSTTSSSYIESDGSVGGFDISVNMSAGTTYYIDIHAASGYSTSSCTFSVSAAVGSARASAIELTLGVVASTGGLTSGAIKWYKFTPSASGTYTISSSTYSGDPDLEVYNSVSSSSPIEFDNDHGGFSKSVVMTSGTTYYIGIQAVGTSSCSFSVSRISDGSTRDRAIEAAPNSSLATGNISSGGSKWYKFTPLTSGTYVISSLDCSGYPQVYVYDSASSSSFIAQDADGDGSIYITVEMTAGTTYYIRVSALQTYIYPSSCTLNIN